MLFTWDTTNLCVIFRWWHIRSTPGLLFSLLAIIALAAGYECLRSFSRRFERWAASSQSDIPSTSLPPLPPSLHHIHASTFLFRREPKAETACPVELLLKVRLFCLQGAANQL